MKNLFKSAGSMFAFSESRKNNEKSRPEPYSKQGSDFCLLETGQSVAGNIKLASNPRIDFFD